MAALSRRWCNVFAAAVHTLTFREKEPPLSMGYEWFNLCDYCGRGGDPENVRAPRFINAVAAALLGRHRGGAAAPPLRALRVVFDEFGFRGGDTRMAVDGWISYAACHAAAGDDGGLEIDLRLDGEPVCKRKYALHGGGGGGYGAAEEAERPMYTTPKSLFSSATLRVLRLGRCRLGLPATVALPALETMHLTRVTGESGAAVQRLVTACPRLAGLTLEDCDDLTCLSVLLPTRLRRLALRCCHNLTGAVDVEASELRVFEYRGAVLGPGFLTLCGDLSKISQCKLDICGEEPAAPPELNFLQLFAGVERLHLTSARLGRGVVGHGVGFSALRNLELTGMLPDDDEGAIAAATRILEQTPNLETLSLFFLPEPHLEGDSYRNDRADEETIHAAHKLRYDRNAAMAVPEVEIYCMRERIREINFVHYQGAMAQRMLAKFLLRNAPVVSEVL
ncbi:hypothetical protein HU200_054093 [Digitaria exilis]|uniref:At1g61320/AtMIF1 LRR domain-containing protein n=1 Tax=Digitaria exilis TaxID=1010633 RepID=A0A835ANG7_9POAL|nr:hypothetical protein HU200_054093 [Digitaria exilis]